MPVNTNLHSIVIPLKTVSGNTPLTDSIAEKAGQTFKKGSPVQLSAGFVQVWDGATIALGILGFSEIPASNLPSNGAGAPNAAFGQVQGSKSIQTYGSVPNETGAVNIALGAPFTDGRTLYCVANDDIIWEGMFDNSAGAVAADYTPTQTDIGKQYGLTFDSNNGVYVDKNKLTVGTNTVLMITGVNPIDGFVVNARVQFKIVKAAQQRNA